MRSSFLQWPVPKDESTPECDRCQTFGIPRDYMPNSTAANAKPALEPNPSSLPMRRRRGRPRSNWLSHPAPVENNALAVAASAVSGRVATDLTLDTLAMDVEAAFDFGELDAYLHYITSPGDVVGSCAKTWQPCTLNLTEEHLHFFLYDAVISLSASHLARTATYPSSALASYVELAARRLAASLRAALYVLPELRPDEYQPVYLTGILACFASLARGPSPGDLLVIMRAGRTPWLAVLAGVRSIAHSDRRREASLVHDLLSDARGDVVVRYGVGSSTTGACQVMSQLRSAGGGASCRFMILSGWLYRLSDEYVSGLEANDKSALLILGRFAVVLGRLEDEYWWLKGWSTHLQGEIGGILSQDEAGSKA